MSPAPQAPCVTPNCTPETTPAAAEAAAAAGGGRLQAARLAAALANLAEPQPSQPVDAFAYNAAAAAPGGVVADPAAAAGGAGMAGAAAAGTRVIALCTAGLFVAGDADQTSLSERMPASFHLHTAAFAWVQAFEHVAASTQINQISNHIHHLAVIILQRGRSLVRWWPPHCWLAGSSRRV